MALDDHDALVKAAVLKKLDSTLKEFLPGEFKRQNADKIIRKAASKHVATVLGEHLSQSALDDFMYNAVNFYLEEQIGSITQSLAQQIVEDVQKRLHVKISYDGVP